MHNHSRNSSDRRKHSPDCDPYLVSVVNGCKQPAEKVSENIAVVLDELGITSARRRVALLLKRAES